MSTTPTSSEATVPNNSTMPLSNQELVQRRLEISRAKRESRRRSMVERHQYNLELKRKFESASTAESGTPLPYQLKVTTDKELRNELKLSGREKRGRLFVERNSSAAQSLKGLQHELHSFFRALRKSTYTLSAGFPKVETNGTLGVPETMDEVWPLQKDEDVVRTFEKADHFYETSNQGSSMLKRPSIVIYVQRDPNAPPPPPPPSWLQGMPDPADSPTMTMLSFYAFPPSCVADPEAFAVQLRKLWKPFAALGRVYVAQEGVNAQMSVPTNVLDQFWESCRSVPELGEWMENGINVDPVPLMREEFSRAALSANGQPAPPFKNLHIRVRRQVVADGLDKAYDWQAAGYDMPPLEWHAKLKQARELREQQSQEQNGEQLPIVLDCRNTYETDMGRFDGSEPLDTVTFRDSWDALKDRLGDTPKDAPIMTYCTGGIRCVKVGAYLTQEMGFTNVSRLAGGIIAYDRELNEKRGDEEEALFKGTNFVFDGRLGRPITEDALGTCITCGAETSLVSNCCNENCHKRIVQCEHCRTSYSGTCSEACRSRLMNGGMLPQRPNRDDGDIVSSDSTSTAPVKYKSLAEYSSGHSSPAPSIYPELEFNTKALIPTGSHMVSGCAQGRLLAQLASMTRHGRVLELGTFTGYATACLLEGAANAASAAYAVSSMEQLQHGSRQGGPLVMTMERDSRAFDIATAQLRIVCQLGMGEAAAEALSALRHVNQDQVHAAVPVVSDYVVSLSFPSASSSSDGGSKTIDVGCDLVRVTDALAVVEQMAAGRGSLQPVAPFDLVFIDADKTRLLDYVEACLATDRVLAKGGLIVVDNVLWKGLVLEAGSDAGMDDDNESNEIMNAASTKAEQLNDEEYNLLKKNRRARKLASKLHRFNDAIVRDPRVEVVVLPVRDGLSVIRKKVIT